MFNVVELKFNAAEHKFNDVEHTFSDAKLSFHARRRFIDLGVMVLAYNCPLMLFIVHDNTLVRKTTIFPNYVSLYQKALLVVEIYYFSQHFHD